MTALILTRKDVLELLDMHECIQAVERAFRLYGAGEATPPAVASVHVPGGAFHTKAGVLPFDRRSYFVAKTNGNFPGNPAQHGLPTVQGTLVICDGELGTALAIMDANPITALRTAAATAVAAKVLTRADASILSIIGCGLQGHMHLNALSLVRRLSRVVLYDTNPEAASGLAGVVTRELNIPVSIADAAAEAARESDLCVTCTTSQEFLLHAGDVPRGAFVAGVGVDSERKRELDPSLMKESKVIADVVSQCVMFGDLHHAVHAGAMTAEDVHANLGEVVAGKRPGRESSNEVIVFDSTGMALQDVAAAGVVYERAIATGRGLHVDFNA